MGGRRALVLCALLALCAWALLTLSDARARLRLVRLGLGLGLGIGLGLGLGLRSGLGLGLACDAAYAFSRAAASACARHGWMPRAESARDLCACVSLVLGLAAAACLLACCEPRV